MARLLVLLVSGLLVVSVTAQGREVVSVCDAGDVERTQTGEAHAWDQGRIERHGLDMEDLEDFLRCGTGYGPFDKTLRAATEVGVPKFTETPWRRRSAGQVREGALCAVGVDLEVLDAGKACEELEE